jgi:hypothetical protein
VNVRCETMSSTVPDVESYVRSNLWADRGPRRGTRTLNVVRAALSHARRRAELAEAQLQLAAEQLDGMECDERLHVLIGREWRRVLTADERREFPLNYRLTPEFVTAAERQADLSLARLGWTCAMLAASYAPALWSIRPLPLSDGPDDAEIRRDDGSIAMYCDLALGPRLRYWQGPDARLEFAAIDAREDLALLAFDLEPSQISSPLPSAASFQVT